MTQLNLHKSDPIEKKEQSEDDFFPNGFYVILFLLNAAGAFFWNMYTDPMEEGGRDYAVSLTSGFESGLRISMFISTFLMCTIAGVFGLCFNTAYKANHYRNGFNELSGFFRRLAIFAIASLALALSPLPNYAGRLINQKDKSNPYADIDNDRHFGVTSPSGSFVYEYRNGLSLSVIAACTFPMFLLCASVIRLNEIRKAIIK